MKRCPHYDGKTKQSVTCKGLCDGQLFVMRFDSIAGRKAYTEEYCWNGIACLDCGIYRVLRGDYDEPDPQLAHGWRIWNGK